MGIVHSRLQLEQQLRKYSTWGILASKMFSRGIFQTMPLKDGETPQSTMGMEAGDGKFWEAAYASATTAYTV